MRGTSQYQLELGSRVRLRQILPGAHLHCFDTGFDAWIARHQNDEGIGSGRHNGFEHVDPGHGSHVDVDEHDVEPLAPNHFDRFFAAGCDLYYEAFAAENAGAALAKRPVVMDDKGTHSFALGVERRGGIGDCSKILAGQRAGHRIPVVLFIVDKIAARSFVIEGSQPSRTPQFGNSDFSLQTAEQ